MTKPAKNPSNYVVKKLDGFVRNRPWQAISGVAVLTFFLGSSGVLWDYLTYSQGERRDFRERVELARQLQSDMTAIQREIIDLVPQYLELRDVRDENGKFLESAALIAAATRLIKLVEDYNRLEARRSFVEENLPRWFPIRPMIPIMPPTLHQPTLGDPTSDGKVTANFTWDNNRDRVLEGVRKDLMRIYTDYHQEYPTTPVPEVDEPNLLGDEQP